MTTAPELSAGATELLGAWGKAKGATAESYRQLIEALERIAKTAPTLTITLAGPAPQAVKEHLVTWCRQNLSQNVLVTFGFNRTLLGVWWCAPAATFTTGVCTAN